MKRFNYLAAIFTVFLATVFAWLSGASSGKPENASSPGMKTAPFSMSSVSVDGGFWGQKQELVRKVTMPAEWEQLEAHHHVDNFRMTAGEKEGIHRGAVFLDSDLYKWLEAASYYIGKHPEDEWLKQRVRELTRLVCKAQMEDGYLNTYYQNFAPEQRFSNLWMDHELYCAGHLMEAAVAHHEATGTEELLGPARKFADLIEDNFGPEGRQGMPGHQEIELALMRMHGATGDYLETAEYFVYERGKDEDFVKELLKDLADQARLSGKVQRRRRTYLGADYEKQGSYGGIPFIRPNLLARIFGNFYSGKYFQTHKPILEQKVAEGHAVRAMYYYAGAADLYLENRDPQLFSALSGIFDNTTRKRTYITGGMGALPVIEGFGKDYELPHKSYTETCAAVGSVFFSWRMLLATGHAKYAEQIERTLYNGFLSGLSLDGRKFFYENPLVARGDMERKPWYAVACCPPNIARLIASLDKYIYTRSEDGLMVHQYISGEVRMEDDDTTRVRVESGLPWSGNVKITIHTKAPRKFSLYLRQPSWADSFQVEVNGNPLEYEARPGHYMDLERTWKKGDTVILKMGMVPRLVHGDPRVKANRGRAAIMYGPLVYCLEDKDNAGIDVHRAVMAKDPDLRAEFRPDLLGGVVAMTGKTADGETFTAVPYYAWANRGKSHMEVWTRTEDVR